MIEIIKNDEGATQMAKFQLMGMPIWVYAKDIDTKGAIERARLIEGHVDESFNVEPKEIDGYRFVSAAGVTAGVFTQEDTHTITFYYRHAQVAETQALTDKYLHVFSEVQPVVSIEDQTAIGQKLWSGSVAKVAQRMASRTGEFWYQLADSRWVKYDMRVMKLANDDGRNQRPAFDWQRPTNWEPVTYHATGSVDYVPGADIAVYAQPYGREIGRLQHGVEIEITEKVIDSAQVTWYHIAQQGWISSIYASLDD